MNYLQMIGYGTASNKAIEKITYGKSKRSKNLRSFEPLRLGEPLFHLTVDDLP